MQIYLVGGAVRDKLLGRTVTEKDWVVVGATVSDMLQQGYRQVGKDFPVFLHPQTQEEYALARIERKISRGYTGFTFDASPTVSLADDLRRRDLTINAIAETATGELIDPYHGQEDLQQKILRHVSAAFTEDPVRILRVARFAARFAGLGFKVAPETQALMREMVHAGEVDALVAERVWKELERALKEPYPEQFFHVLQACDALLRLFPELVMADMTVLMGAHDPHIRFAALLHSLTPAEINALCNRYRVPTDYRELAILVATYHPTVRLAKTLTAHDIADLLQRLDAYRRPARFHAFLRVNEALRLPTQWLADCFVAAQTVTTQNLPTHLTGSAIAEYLHQQRIEQIAKQL